MAAEQRRGREREQGDFAGALPTAAMLIDGARFGDEFLADCSPGSGRGRRADGVNVRCWQETYRGLMSDAVLDDPGFLAARERFWTVALTDERYRENRVAVAERDGELVGIAMSGPPLDATATWARQLYVLSVYAADHGALREPAETLPGRDDSRCEQHAEAQQSVVAGVGFDRLISRSRQRVGAAAGRSARFTLL